MKKNLINYYKLLFCFFLFLGTYSCQTEEISEADSSSLEAKKSKKNPRQGLIISNCDEVYDSVNLYAGQHILVGNVTVTGSDGNYDVTYNITNVGYCLVETHLSVVTNVNDFPMNNGGNPVPGQFEYSNENHSCISSYTYSVNLSDYQTRDDIYVAAHAVVNCVNDVTEEAFEMSLPDQVDVCVTEKGVYPSYFDVLINEENSLSGSYEAWCIDTDLHLEEGQCFTGDVYSSYESLPDGAFEQTNNFGAVNWLINQSLIDSEASADLGNYTFGDIQLAIWSLVDDFVCTDCAATGPFDLDRVDILVGMALENNDYVPTCGENLAIVIIPTNNLQSIFIEMPVPCGECSETAWAAGCDFPGNNWSTFFKYN